MKTSHHVRYIRKALKQSRKHMCCGKIHLKTIENYRGQNKIKYWLMPLAMRWVQGNRINKCPDLLKPEINEKLAIPAFLGRAVIWELNQAAVSLKAVGRVILLLMTATVTLAMSIFKVMFTISLSVKRPYGECLLTQFT